MKINIPTPLRAFTDKQATVEVNGATVQAGLDALVAARKLSERISGDVPCAVEIG